jgi:voltage-gated potassium channel Kch
VELRRTGQARDPGTARRVRRALAASALIGGLGACGYGDHGDYFYFTPYNIYSSIVVGDFDGDGAADLALAGAYITGSSPDAGFVSVIRGNPAAAGTFMKGVHYAVGVDPSNLVVADFNGDGHPDFVTNSDPISFLLQNPSALGTFSAGASLSAGLPNNMAAADLNNDGRVDLVVAACSSVLVYLQSGSGTFTAPTSIPTPAGLCATAVAIGDINGDGKPDLVVTAAGSSGTNGAAWLLPQDPANAGSFISGATLTVGQRPVAVHLADLNGDSLLDIVVLNEGSVFNGVSSTVSVLLQSATPGAFLPAVSYTTGAHSEDFAVGDLNGDGRLDLVVANIESQPGAGDSAIVVLLQNPASAGAFLAPAAYAGVSNPFSVAIGDLNGDGKPDIAAADDNGAEVLFQVPGAPGTFQAAVNAGN